VYRGQPARNRLRNGSNGNGHDRGNGHGRRNGRANPTVRRIAIARVRARPAPPNRLGLYAVADGMGGHNAGEVASALAAKSLHEFLVRAEEANESTLAEAVCLANDQVLDAANTNSTYEGMGTTVVAACVKGGSVVFANVGDSRIYRMSGGALKQLTHDDSWVSRVLPADAIGSLTLQKREIINVRGPWSAPAVRSGPALGDPHAFGPPSPG